MKKHFDRALAWCRDDLRLLGRLLRAALYGLLVALIYITLPIWAVPYMIGRKIKGGSKNA